MSDYFSDRETGPKPQTGELITKTAWVGIVALVDGLINQGAFGYDYPENCPDGPAIVATDSKAFGLAVQAEVPGFAFPLKADCVSDSDDSIASRRMTLMALDFIEFCHRHVANAERKTYHSFFRHHHLTFDPEVGRAAFREHINRIFARNAIEFYLHEGGMIHRLAPVPGRMIRGSDMPSSGDATLDGLIDQSLSMFLNVDPAVRKDALDKLWDAWERLKSIEDGNKKRSAEKLLSMAAELEPFAYLLHEEAQKLTKIGNNFQIRHTETNKEPLTNSKQVDYLYVRLLNLIHLLITARSEVVNQ